MGYRLVDLAREVGASVEGDPQLVVESIRTLASAGPRDLAFLTNPRYRAQAEQSRAGALLVPPGLAGLGRNLLVAEDPNWALACLLRLFHPTRHHQAGIHPTAVVGSGCAVAATAHVGAYVVLGEGCRIGEGAVLHPHVVLGRHCQVGPGAVLHPQVVLYDDTEVGEGCILHSGVVLGADGFGFAFHEGRHEKVPQVGRVVVEAEVEIGANSTVDRAALEVTRVGAGTKIDNLVHIAHNVQVGRSCLLVAQAGIAGSTRLGDGVVMAGQSGIAGHLELGDGVRVAAKTAVFKSVPAGTQVAGIPAVEAQAWRRQQALVARLADMRRSIRALERRLGGAGQEEEGE